MNIFNLFKEIIIVQRASLEEAIKSDKIFGIRTDGSICHEPFGAKDILVFCGLAEKKEPLEKALGKNYQVVVDEERVLLKAFANWQEIIGYNKARATYDDTTADGVDEFATKEMEAIGWHATEFNINYRTLVEVLERECEGVVICIEQEEPYKFSGLGFVDDLDKAKDVLFAFCKKEIEKLIATDNDFKKENLSDDEQEAAEFFSVLL